MKYIIGFLIGVVVTVAWYQVSAFVGRVNAMEQYLIHLSESQ